MFRWGRTVAWSAGLSAALIVVLFASAAIGPVHLSPLTVMKAILAGLSVPTSASLRPRDGPALAGLLPVVQVGFEPLFSLTVDRTAAIIVQRIRLPRIALAGVVGFALATAGVVMQGFFRNPMADPSIIGVSAGAAVGAVAAIVFPFAVPFGLQTAAFVGALVAATAVFLIATENGRTPVATLLLAGIAVQTFLGAVVSVMLLQAGESMERAIFWLMGHLSNSTWGEVAVTLPIVLIGFATVAVYARDINVLLLGEADAQSLGIEVERTKLVLLVFASVLTAAAVAVAGIIGFVGLVVPHVLRLLVGPDHRILLPTSALAGAIFLILADTVARMGPAELPVGIVTAALGAPFFLYLLRRREVYEL